MVNPLQNSPLYPLPVRTIEEIRLANFRRIVDEVKRAQGLEGDSLPTGPAVAARVGISSVYAWQLMSGKRDRIDSKGARSMEVAAGKPVGWMDTDFDMWPFPGLEYERIASLSLDQRMEIQGAIRALLIDFTTDGSGKSPPSQSGAQKQGKAA